MGLLAKAETVRSLMCDRCGVEIPNGQKVVAVTMWREMEPEMWEHEYGYKSAITEALDREAKMNEADATDMPL
jgi:hypothetical protein